MKCASCLLSGAIRGLACSLKAGLVLFVGGRWVRAFGCLPSRGGLDRLHRGTVRARLGLVAPTSRRDMSGLRFCSNAPD